MVVSYPLTCMLGTDLGSSAQIVCALTEPSLLTPAQIHFFSDTLVVLSRNLSIFQDLLV